MKKIVNNADEIILNAVKKFNSIVSSTLGPKGYNVMIDRNLNYPMVTKDGVTVADNVQFNDKVEDTIIRLIRGAASKMSSEVGDGPQPLYSKVYTPTGPVNIGSLKIGDEICGTKSSVQKVLGVYPKGKLNIYKVKFSNGAVVECNDTHLWTVTTSNGTTKTLPLSEIIKDYKSKSVKGWNKYKYYIPTSQVEYADTLSSNDIDPYLLGLLLGDGSLSDNASIELSLSLNKESVINNIILPNNIEYHYKKDLDKNYIRLKFRKLNKDADLPSMYTYLESIGLLNKKSNDKFIPKKYLYSSLVNRYKLLKGLLDTDGYTNNRGLFEYSTVSKQLFEDFVELCTSLSIPITYRLINRSGNSYSNTPIYRIQELKGYKHGFKIIDIENTNTSTEMVCIKVSNPDSLYYTDGHMLTHNTTTATVIACTTVETLLPVIREHNLNVYKVSEILSNYANIVEKYISKKSIIVDASSKKKQKLLESVIRVSTNGDKELTSLIYNTILTVKSDGALTVKESKTSESHVEYVDGYKIDSGLLLSNFITNISRGNTELQNPLILIAKDKITSTKEQILPLLNYCNRKGRPLVIITMDIEQEPLGAILINHLEHNVHSAVIRLEGPIARKEWVIEDLAKLTGATIVDSNMGKPFYKIDYETWLGTANIFVADRFISNLIVKEKTQEFKDYMSYLGHLLNNSKGIDKQRLIERIAKLEGSSATIYVGGETDAEIKEKMDRIDDAVSAARAALSGGVISGGGSELYRLSYLSKDMYSTTFSETKESVIMAELVSKILRSPMHMIIHNALGGSEITKDVEESLEIVATINNTGIDVSNELEFADMIACGIVDPAMVTIKAVKTGLSVAALLLTTKFIIVNDNDEYVLNNQNPLPYAF